MNYSLVSFILVIIPLSIILIVIIKKFPQLAVLDVENMPEVKAGKKKDEVFKKRVEEKAAKAKVEWLKKLMPFVGLSKKIQDSFRNYVAKLTQRVEAERKKNKPQDSRESRSRKRQSIFTLLHEGDSARSHEDYETAENRYITAIKIDPKNIEAYHGLAEVYTKQDQTKEAQETYEFILQLNSQDDEALVKLAEIFEKNNNIKEAIDYYQRSVLANDNYPHRFVKLAELLMGIQEYETALAAIEQAVELEPNNPKYLDIMTEISIMSEHKEIAEEAYQKLRLSNPENQKLESFRDRIAKL